MKPEELRRVIDDRIRAHEKKRGRLRKPLLDKLVRAAKGVVSALVDLVALDDNPNDGA